MAKTVAVIGIEDKELRWVRSLILLLRHPDPSIPGVSPASSDVSGPQRGDRPNKSPPAVGRAS